MRQFTILLALALVGFGFSYVTSQPPVQAIRGPEVTQVGGIGAITTKGGVNIDAIEYKAGQFLAPIGVMIYATGPFQYALTMYDAAKSDTLVWSTVDTMYQGGGAMGNFTYTHPCWTIAYGNIDSISVAPAGSDTAVYRVL